MGERYVPFFHVIGKVMVDRNTRKEKLLERLVKNEENEVKF